ncbi:MAG: DUF1992 domain-containing protein [Thermomicrobiales bacterium]|nr:DUF1992 domain-containing protein [Thermomicrobiales bacterium]
MSPLHHDGEKIVAHASWQSWIDEAIAEARDRGEFDDLPGSGQPLRIEENPFAGDWALAFHVLENADMAPPWIELTREIREGMADLAERRERAARRQREGLAAARELEDEPPATRPARPRWWRRWRQPAPEPPWGDRRRRLLDQVAAERRWARRDYLERAAKLDELIAAYNAWLPDTLRRLQKGRLPASRAAREFDEACPPPP